LKFFEIILSYYDTIKIKNILLLMNILLFCHSPQITRKLGEKCISILSPCPSKFIFSPSKLPNKDQIYRKKTNQNHMHRFSLSGAFIIRNYTQFDHFTRLFAIIIQFQEWIVVFHRSSNHQE